MTATQALQIDFGQVMWLAGAAISLLLGALAALIKILFAQYEHRLAEQLSGIQRALDNHVADERRSQENLQRMEADHQQRWERIHEREKHWDRRLDGHAERLARAETRLDHVLSKDDLGRVYDRINAIAKEVDNGLGSLSGTLREQGKDLQMIKEALLSREK